MVSADPRYRWWRHPWHVRVRWDASLESWVATVRVGFVNGVVPTVVEALPDEDGEEIDRARPLDLSRGILLDAWLGYGKAANSFTPVRVPDYFPRRGMVEVEGVPDRLDSFYHRGTEIFLGLFLRASVVMALDKEQTIEERVREEEETEAELDSAFLAFPYRAISCSFSPFADFPGGRGTKDAGRRCR